MTTARTLNEISAQLEEMSITLDEIKDGGTHDTSQLDQVQSEIERAVEIIDESLNTTHQPRVP
jgi:hypothetical protein